MNVAEPADAPLVPRPDPALDRAQLLAAVAQAASAAAAGIEISGDQRSLDGRQFELRIRFGCRGPSSDLPSEWLGWSHDAKAGSLRVRAAPTITAESPIVTELGADQFEAVEGFWIPRPWLQQAVCPAAAAVKAAPQQPAADQAPVAKGSAQPAPGKMGEPQPAAVRPRVGIVQLFTSTDARTSRRSERAYEAVKALEPGQPITSQGFNLVLSGRLRAVAGKPVVQCVARGPDSPPDCLISADFDRVWIERPDGGEVVAEWGSG